MTEVDEIREEARRNTRARFEQWAKNPTCHANTLSAVHNVRLDAAAEAVGLVPSFGQSPFAIARGNRFEAGLFFDGAVRLRESLQRKACLPANANGFLDLRLKINGGARIRTIDEALSATENWLKRIAVEPTIAEAIVAAPMLRIPKGVMLPEALLIIDAAITTQTDAGRPHITVLEIKVFPDRGGHTDAHQLASARAQAGLYRHALELAISAMGLESDIVIAADGILVFTWPGSNSPAIRAGEDLTYQVIRAKRGFERLEEVAQAIVRQDDFASDNPALIQRLLEAHTEYGESCLSFCDLAPRCHQRAFDSDDTVILGDEVKRMLGEIPIARSIELLDGAQPQNDREADLQRQFGVQ